MLGKVFGGLEDYAPLLIRLGLGIIFIHAGGGKIFGWFNGMGLEKTTEQFGMTGLDLPLPILMASLTGMGELVGGFLVMIGLITRYAAATLVFIMIIAIAVAHRGNIFTPAGMAAFACGLLAASLLFSGGGKGSLDRVLKIDERV